MAKHDPVSALAEEDATGTIADIFEDIRQTMHLPLLTSIWRILAADEASLVAVWQTVKPIFECGLPEQSFKKLAQCPLPIPPPPVAGQFEAAGVKPGDLATIRYILDVYNRSNSLNFLVLSAILAEPAQMAVDAPTTTSMTPNIGLPPLLSETDLPPALWQFLHELNKFGASPDEPGLATVWRHLSHWPGFLAITHAALTPLQNQGAIADCIQLMLTFAKTEAPRLAHAKNVTPDIPAAAKQTIARYVTHPGLVVRMVTIGLGLSSWLAHLPNPANP